MNLSERAIFLQFQGDTLPCSEATHRGFKARMVQPASVSRKLQIVVRHDLTDFVIDDRIFVVQQTSRIDLHPEKHAVHDRDLLMLGQLRYEMQETTGFDP